MNRDGDPEETVSPVMRGWLTRRSAAELLPELRRALWLVIKAWGKVKAA